MEKKLSGRNCAAEREDLYFSVEEWAHDDWHHTAGEMKDPSSGQRVVRELGVVRASGAQPFPRVGLLARRHKLRVGGPFLWGRGRGCRWRFALEECIPVAAWVLGPLWTVGPCYPLRGAESLARRPWPFPSASPRPALGAHPAGRGWALHVMWESSHQLLSQCLAHDKHAVNVCKINARLYV